MNDVLLKNSIYITTTKIRIKHLITKYLVLKTIIKDKIKTCLKKSKKNRI